MSLLWTTGTATRRGCTRASTPTLIYLLPPWRTPFGAPLEFPVQRSRYRERVRLPADPLSASLGEELREFLLDPGQDLGGIRAPKDLADALEERRRCLVVILTVDPRRAADALDICNGLQVRLGNVDVGVFGD